jgi:hypothetical protein
MWTRVAQILLIGYMSMSKSFAYVGVPQLKVFIGEIALGAFMLGHARTFVGVWAAAIVRPSPLSGVVWAVCVFLGCGVFQLLHGIGLGYPAVTALQNLVFNYYPLYLFLGLWVAARTPDFLPRFVRTFAWWNGIYGVVTLVIGNNFSEVYIPGTTVALIGGSSGSSAVLIGLLAFERNVAKVWPLLVLNGFVMLGMQIRAEWLGFVVAVLVWGILTRALGRVAIGTIAVLTLLVVMYLTDFSIPAPWHRGGSISLGEIVGRALSAVDPVAAQAFTERAGAYAGTVSWRTDWWRAIWASVHRDPMVAIFGFGYGFPLTSLVPYLQGHTEIRTPHNVLLYALGYGGWTQVAAFVALQGALLRLLWTAYRATGQAFGLAFWALGITIALFGNFFETPSCAIPFYLLVGLSIVPALRPRETDHARAAVA